jgi:hypothetical protein
MSDLAEITDEPLTAESFKQQIEGGENLEVLNNRLLAARIGGPPPAEPYVVSPPGARAQGSDNYMADGTLIDKLMTELPDPSVLPKLTTEFGVASTDSKPEPSYSHDHTLEA